jgi:uncharacterized phage-associated protein
MTKYVPLVILKLIDRGGVIFDPAQIANYLIERQPNLTPMALQKLIYIAHGYYLAAMGKPLLDETVEAWQWGPVIPSLYHKLKAFGSAPVTSRLKGEDGEMDAGETEDSNVNALLDKVLQEYGSIPAYKLMAITHLPDGPWQTVVEECKKNYGGLPKSKEIDNEIIRQYYKQRIAANGG